MNWEEYDPMGTDLIFQASVVTPNFKEAAKEIGYKILSGNDQYKKVEAKTGVPWFIVGTLHQMETGGSWEKHLHNGDPLSNRTTHVPKGRPVKNPVNGIFPYTWEESACDALENYPPHPGVWDAGHALIYLEAYNGFGYRKVGCPSPYVWSGTGHYYAGKFSSDNVFDATLVSKQVGAACILKTLLEWKMIDLI